MLLGALLLTTACGDDSQPLPPDMATSACVASGGTCIAIEGECTGGANIGKLGCDYYCCGTPEPCTFSACDGGSCACGEGDVTCKLPATGAYCTCQEAAGTFSWTCGSP
jgi:hypothetical protein